MSMHVIGGLVLRYLFLYTRSWIRLVEVVFWPAVDLLVWGYLTMFLQREVPGGEFPQFIMFLIGGMILWDILFRAQQGVSISFLEDVWTRNVINIFIAPVRIVEYLAATFLVGLLRIALTMVILLGLAYVVYGFNILSLGLALIPFVANLLLFGWCLGIVATALILRWGPAAESLAWAVPFLVQPVAAVFYPVDVLPPWLQAVAHWIPCAHIFEGMRSVLRDGTFDVGAVWMATGLNLLYLSLAGLLFGVVLRIARERGLLSKFALT